MLEENSFSWKSTFCEVEQLFLGSFAFVTHFLPSPPPEFPRFLLQEQEVYVAINQPSQFLLPRESFSPSQFVMP